MVGRIGDFQGYDRLSRNAISAGNLRSLISAIPQTHFMNILWAKPGKLLPLDSGGKLRSYNILRQLSVRYPLTYLSITPAIATKRTRAKY